MFDLIFKKKKSALTNETTEPEPVCKAPEPGRISILCTEKPENSATFGQGEVHCLLSNGTDYIVGYYDFDSDGVCHVQRESDKVEIASVKISGGSGHEFWLSLTTYPVYYSWLKKDPKFVMYKKPNHMLVDVRAYGLFMEDGDTHQEVAKYSGDPIEAIAAFAAMTYELLYDSPYRKIYDDFFVR